MKKKKTLSVGIVILCMVLVFAMVPALTGCGGENAVKELPKPEITGGARGEMGIDKNINEATIDQYLGREDAVYRDMRMLEDPAQYEKIGGDRFLSGYVEGFEVVPLPYIMPVNGLPSAVGETYSGDTLFYYNDNYEFVPKYEESIAIMEELFPKDKVIFLMCGGGGYAGMTKNFLISLGWDPDKIYNVGGYWFYQGEHNVQVKKEENGQVSYDFDSVPYHDIDFSKLTKFDYKVDPNIKLTNLVLSGHSIELEEDTTFKLTAIEVPFDLPYTDLYWESSNESVAKADFTGTVVGISPGTATITVQNEDASIMDSCEVTVLERPDTEHVTLDELAEESKAFTDNDPNAIMDEFSLIGEDMDEAVEKGYYYYDGEGYAATELWTKEYEKTEAKAAKAIKARTEVLNKILADQRTFILIVFTKDCDGREYQTAERADAILTEKGIPHFYTNDMVSGYDSSLHDSNIDYDKVTQSAITIFKEGAIYASLNPDLYSIKSDEDLINWLSKYIDM